MSDNINAKEELLGITTKENIHCAKIFFDWFGEEGDAEKTMYLCVGGDVDEFLNKLDFNYASGYGSQYQYGVVWLNDGSWLERGEYDGSEWWTKKERPEIPEILQKEQP